jgi:3-carboxy-cis,cis-muconate cycloisomerase
VLAERVVLELTRRVGRAQARAAVRAAARADEPFRDALLAQPAIATHLDAAAVDELLDPAGYLGATDELIARALARHEREVGA